VLPYAGTTPQFASPPAHGGRQAAVLGRASLGRQAWLGARSVIRADGHYVRIGDRFRFGAGSTVHIAHDLFPAEIGNDVTAGANSVIHACEVGDRCHLGDDVVVLDGSRLAAECALADGAIVFPRSRLEGGWVHEGMPAKPVRRLEAGEIERLHAASRAHAEADDAADGELPDAPAGTLLVAATARLAGRIRTEGDNGIWFGCVLDAGAHEISVGVGTNIQDNTTIRCRGTGVRIGGESTIGHNVRMTDCEVGDRSLVGIGAIVAPGTRIQDEVFLGAGAHTTPGQVLEKGWFYGGRPARKIAPLDEAKREAIAMTWPIYCEYGRRFDEAQKQLRRLNA
jgi:carbonic anhydrase/acetyltransferase-like protein (isoleucine patch superfamily)